jgi:hypothetical protein
MKDQIDELRLVLLHLTSFKEDFGLVEVQRRWKGYPFESLNELAEINAFTKKIQDMLRLNKILHILDFLKLIVKE